MPRPRKKSSSSVQPNTENATSLKASSVKVKTDKQPKTRKTRSWKSAPVTSSVIVEKKYRKRKTLVENNSKEELLIIHINKDKDQKTNKRSQQGKHAQGDASASKRNMRSLRKRIVTGKEEPPANKEESFIEIEASVNKDEDNKQIDEQHKVNKGIQQKKHARGTHLTSKKNILTSRKNIRAKKEETPVNDENYVEKEGTSMNKEDNEQIDKRRKVNKNTKQGKRSRATSAPKKNANNLRENIHRDNYAEKEENSMIKEVEDENTLKEGEQRGPIISRAIGVRLLRLMETPPFSSTPKEKIRRIRKNMYTKNEVEEPSVIEKKAQENKPNVTRQNKRKTSEMIDLEILPQSKRKRNLAPQIERKVASKDPEKIEQKRGRKRKVEDAAKKSDKVRANDTEIPADSKRRKTRQQVNQ